VNGIVDRQGVPGTVPLTVYRFDRRGHQTHVAAPGGAVTEFRCTGTGKVAEKIENAFGAPEERRSTRYIYRFGRLAGIRADRLPSATDPQTQFTLVEFGASAANDWGAEVVDPGLDEGGTQVKSRHGTHVRSMFLNDEATADTPSVHPHLFLRYDFLGRLAERIDERGVALRYRYDDVDRLSSVEVGHYETGTSGTVFVSGYPESVLLPGGGVPVNRVGFVRYTYADDHRTFDAWAYEQRPPPGSPAPTPIAHNRMEFDARGQLIADWQSLGEEISAATPRTRYAWDVQFTGTPGGLPHDPPGRQRLASMTYPAFPGLDERVVTLGYGAPGSADDRLSRIASMTTSPAGPGPETVAAFTYVGSSRRARTEVAGGAIVRDLGLDTEPGSDGGRGRCRPRASLGPARRWHAWSTRTTRTAIA
jgi:YD repeat-containing protein